MNKEKQNEPEAERQRASEAERVLQVKAASAENAALNSELSGLFEQLAQEKAAHAQATAEHRATVTCLLWPALAAVYGLPAPLPTACL